MPWLFPTRPLTAAFLLIVTSVSLVQGVPLRSSIPFGTTDPGSKTIHKRYDNERLNGLLDQLWNLRDLREGRHSMEQGEALALRRDSLGKLDAWFEERERVLDSQQPANGGVPPVYLVGEGYKELNDHYLNIIDDETDPAPFVSAIQRVFRRDYGDMLFPPGRDPHPSTRQPHWTTFKLIRSARLYDMQENDPDLEPEIALQFWGNSCSVVLHAIEYWLAHCAKSNHFCSTEAKKAVGNFYLRVIEHRMGLTSQINDLTH